MARPPFQTITVKRVKYLVERFRQSDTDPLPIRFILHSPRGGIYWLVPSAERLDRLVARAPMTAFSPFRLPPRHLIGVWFAEDEDGKLVIAPADA
jgi:hypothetical protein